KYGLHAASRCALCALISRPAACTNRGACRICAVSPRGTPIGTNLTAMRGGQLIREARTMAGLTQDELSERSRTARSLIARWEQGPVSPSFDSLLEVIEACGYELPLVLVKRDASLDQRLEKNRQLTPERRARRLLSNLEKDGDG